MIHIPALVALAIVAGPPVDPETLVSLSAGPVFGDYLETYSHRITYAGAVTPFVNEHVGFEFEAAFTPGIFQRFADSSVKTFTGSLLVRAAVGRRLSGFVAIGAGGERSKLYNRTRGREESVWHPCGAAGGGLMFDIHSRFGLRAELKYLRALDETDRLTQFDQEFGDFHVGRATAGVYIRF